ncbi:MAG TPA: proline dehydrogenase family protein, partial [Trebonia sp.]|nr:proline dehydrogenase family protein [Trebonia sp.]
MLRNMLLAAADSGRIREAVRVAPAARAVVDRYVAGESVSEAVATARMLRSAGLLVSLDYLGEDTRDGQRAAATAAQYIQLIGKLAAEGLTEGGAVEVSVKLSALGLLLDADVPVSGGPVSGGAVSGGAVSGGTGPGVLGERVAAEHLKRIAAAAREAGTTVTVDAEDHRTTDATLRITSALRAEFPSAGSVLQAALRRTETDVRQLAAPGVRVRLCKGAYAEPIADAFASRHEIDKSFARCLRILMAGPGYPMIATHDPRLIAITRSLGLARSADGFEYQMLYGVRPDEQRRLAAAGARVRVYVPYGED